MLHRDNHSAPSHDGLSDLKPSDALRADVRREIQAKAATAQNEAVKSALRAATRLVWRAIRAAVLFWNIPVLGPTDARRS